MNKESVFLNFKWSVQALGIPADKQIKAFPEFVVVTDELLLEFANWKEVVVGNFKNELTERQIYLLQKLHNQMANFPEFNIETSDFEILNTSRFFDELRTMAQQVLLEFNWNLEDPPFDRVNYIKA